MKYVIAIVKGLAIGAICALTVWAAVRGRPKADVKPTWHPPTYTTKGVVI